MNRLENSLEFQRLFETATQVGDLSSTDKKAYIDVLRRLLIETQALGASAVWYSPSDMEKLRKTLVFAEKILKRARLWGYGWYYVWGRYKRSLRQALRAHKLRFCASDLRQLIETVLDKQHAWYRTKDRALGYPLFRAFNKGVFPVHIKDALPASKLQWHLEVLRWGVLFRAQWQGAVPHTKALLTQLTQTNALLQRYAALKARASHYFTDNQTENLLVSHAYRQRMRKALLQDFEDLCAFDKHKASLTHSETDMMARLYAQVGEWDNTRLQRLCKESLAVAWIGHIEKRYPCLRAVSTRHFHHQTQRLQALVQEKRALSRRMLGLRLRERTYENAHFTQYAGQKHLKEYRALHKQTLKKRKIWPMRLLMRQFSPELFALMPCWLLTPEAASAIFSMDKHFDLMLFDEASQCFIEHALPALYRSHRFAIMGDSQQLQPNDLYESKWHPDLVENDEEEEIDQENSLLETANTYLPVLILKQHYRSLQLDLIAFSNRRFYDQQLEMLPHYESVLNNRPSIQYLNVKGVWDKNINQKEADRVVELVVDLLQQEPKSTIGVISFNAPQQECIWNGLDRAKTMHSALVDAEKWRSVAVKNIENVQGDEFDICIFSIGYAKGTATGVLRRAFGSLSQPGGHKRLNVAITRAKKRMYIVCSLQPEELPTHDLKSEGGRMLGYYLNYAYEVSQGRFNPMYDALDDKNQHARLSLALQNDANKKPNNPKLAPKLPYADLCYFKQGILNGLVFTDDKDYYEQRSVLDIYVHRPRRLREKGWAFADVYSRHYWMDKKNTLENIKDQLDEKKE